MTYFFLFFFVLIHVGCSGQLTRITTIPHGPMDILQAQEQVRHRGGDRRAHRGSNPRGRTEQIHDEPQQLNPQVQDTHGACSSVDLAVLFASKLAFLLWLTYFDMFWPHALLMLSFLSFHYTFYLNLILILFYSSI